MGLNEKRQLKALQDTTFPERTRELAEICGCPITYEVDWPSLADDLEALNYIDNLSCHRINMAFRLICTDQLGKDALKEGLKTIRLKNVKDPKDMKMSFANGVLEMHCAYAKGVSGMFQDGDIRKLVIDGL